MKRLISCIALLSLLAALLPAAGAAQAAGDWQTVAAQCEELNLGVTWYPDCQGVIRRYGYDRMLLIQDGQSFLFNIKKGWILAGPFDAVDEFDENGHALAAQNGKWGKMDHDGLPLVDFLYDTREEARLADGDRGNTPPVPGEDPSPDTFHEGLRWINAQGSTEGAGAEEFGPWGFADETGRVVVPPIFDAVGYFDYGVASVKVGEVYGLLRSPLEVEKTIEEFHALTGGGFDVTWFDRNTTVGPVPTDQLIFESKVVRSGLRSTDPVYCDHGLLDRKGRRLLPTIYGQTQPGGLVGGERFGVRVPGKYSEDGNEAVYTDILGNEFTVRDTDPPYEGVDVIPNYEAEKPYYYGNYWTKEQLIPGRFDYAHPFSEGIGMVHSDGVTYAIDLSGETLFTLDPSYKVNIWPNSGGFHDGLLVVEDIATGKQGAVDKTGKLAIPCVWESLSDFNEGLALVDNGEKNGYIDASGALVMPCILSRNSGNSNPHTLMRISYNGLQGIWCNPLLKDKVSDWARAGVERAGELDLITDSCAHYQTFSITREQFADLAVNYLEKTTGQTILPAPADTFTDTVDESTLKAFAAGIVQGMGDGSFGPGRPLTREQLATMLWRTLEKAGWQENKADLTAYTDAETVSPWAANALSSLVGHGLMTGTGEGLLSPRASCAVEQAVLLLSRAAP